MLKARLWQTQPSRPTPGRAAQTGLNGDMLSPLLDDSSLALAAEPAAPQKCPSSASELIPTAASPAADPSQEWKVVKIQRVLINPTGEPRKAGLSRSSSLSEKDLKEAKAQSRRIAAQLTTAPGPSSKGVLLFNRRKQRVDGLTGAGHGGGLPLSPTPRPQQAAMEEGEGQGLKPEPDQPSTPGEGLQASISLCQEPPAEAQQVPLSIYMKENMTSATTNGVHDQATGGMERGARGLEDAATPAGPGMVTLALPLSPEEGKSGEVPGELPSQHPEAPVGTATGMASPESQQQNGVQGRQCCEVHLTLAKPKPVKNRTARPFGTQASPAGSQPKEGPPPTELPPPPTYAETLSSPPPLTRVRSPPAYSALYPPWEQKMMSCPPLVYGASGPNPLPKTGILEKSAARRASGKKSMFTFVEKPKLSPNPDLLDLVQSVDSRKKQREQGEPGAEDEPFALGAEAANFVPNSAARDGQHLPPADDVPAWSSCLKSPTIQPKPKLQPSHNLSEARGKGAELFARRQSRMEKFVIEAPSQPELLRSPSPTMSLPPSWKYDINACLSPMVSRRPSKSPSRPSNTPLASLYGGNLENEVSQKELEISKHQPYQLQSSLFILSPSKGPARSMPQEVPPPRPSLPNAYPYPQQTSCPTSPLPPSPIWHPPVVPDAGQTTSNPFPGTAGALPLTHDSHAGPGAPSEVLLASPCRLLQPRAKGGFQAPRPSYSTRNAGIEPQERRLSLPASPTWTPRLARRPGSLDGWASPASVPELDEGPPTSPPWSERSLSPLRQDADPRASRQMQARLARNIINAARRKSSSPKAVGLEGSRPFTPIPAGPPSLPQSPRPARQAASTVLGTLGSPSPTHKSPLRSPRADGPQFCTSPGMPRAAWAEGRRLLLPPGVPSCPVPGLSPSPKSPLPSPVVGGRLPAKRCTSRSPTDSDVSLDSEDSGTKSPGIHSFNLCPRGWTGSLRLKQGGLPSGAPCTS